MSSGRKQSEMPTLVLQKLIYALLVLLNRDFLQFIQES